MKRALLWIFLSLAMSGVLFAQEAKRALRRRPRTGCSFRGTCSGDMASSISLPRTTRSIPTCAARTLEFRAGVNDPCNAFARYMLSGYVEVRPFGRTQLRRFFVFGEPRFVFGKNLPQTLYTWSFDAIGVERSWGAGISYGGGSRCAGPSTFCSAASARVTGIWGRPTSVPTDHGAGTT